MRTSSRPCARVLVAVTGLVMCAAKPAGAQVLQLGEDGVTTYDRPAVFSREGATPIAPPRSSGPGTPRALAVAAEAAALSPELVEAVAWQESRGRHGLVSRKGAVGEMQLMPGTARALRVDARDAEQNYRGGAAYLAQLMRRYGGDLALALAAYNAGPGAVDRHRGAPPYKETQAYVAAVLDRLSRRAEAQGE